VPRTSGVADSLGASLSAPMIDSRNPLRPFAREVVYALTAGESKTLDSAAIETVGVPQPVLMENAGRSAAQITQCLFSEGSVVGIVGSGNNGGDALVLLRTLRAWGREVCAVLVAERAMDDPLLHGWDIPVIMDEVLDQSGWDALLGPCGVAIDGILGIGAKGPPRDRQASAIAQLNRASCPVLAIDVPSGIDSSTGAVQGEAIHATVTVGFGAPKLGSLLSPARAHTGRIVVVDIGFPPSGNTDDLAQVITPLWAQRQLPSRPTDTHKNAVGRLTIIAGQPGMAGAAVLTTRAALTAGAGLVRVCSVPENREILQRSTPEAIYVDVSDDEALQLALEDTDAVVLGPGLGTNGLSVDLANKVTKGPERPLVLDADALNLAAEGFFDLRALGKSRPMLSTPHAGEMSRLLGESKSNIIGDRLAALREAVERFEHCFLLKGTPSLISNTGRGILVGSQGTSDLAVGGMGDTLTGVCGALIAQGLGVMEAGAVSLYLTGRAANLAARGASLTPSDVIRWMPDALIERGAGTSELGFPFVFYDADAAR